MIAAYLVRRWRAFVAPDDLLTMSLLLATGARFGQRFEPVLPNSPAARRVYNDAVHLTVDTWPYPNPAARELSLIDTESPKGAVLDVLRLMDLESGTTGQFVSYVVGTRWTSPTARLVVKPDRWFCDSTTLSLYSPVGEVQSANNSAPALLRPVLDLLAPSIPLRSGDPKTLPWPLIAGMEQAVLEGTQRVLDHLAPTHHFTDPAWDLQPQAPGTDIMFDQVAARMMYTEHTLRLI